LVKGDARSLSIAAASLLAKTARDALMRQLDGDYPVYRFAAHKGYGTQQHRRAIEQFGVCPIHRRSFTLIKAQND
jgi:ribonuclease HII